MYQAAQVISRSEAIARGLKTYYTGKPCKHGHIAGRYVSANSACMECQRLKTRKWVASQPKESILRRNYGAHLKRAYGISLDDYDQMLARQQGRCAICPADKPGGRGPHWHVDHCHETGRVRGLLCARCNAMLGGARDNPTSLLRAVDYLIPETSILAHWSASAALSMGT